MLASRPASILNQIGRRAGIPQVSRVNFNKLRFNLMTLLSQPLSEVCSGTRNWM